MKRLTCLVLLVQLLSAAHAAERFSNSYTQHPEAFFRAGFWWDAADPGWGIDLHMSGAALVGAWATYDDQGHPTWYLGVGTRSADGAWIMPLDRYVRGPDGALAGDPAGELVIRFTDGYHATMSWTLGERSGQYAIEPFIVDPAPIAEDYTGFWYELASPGYGISIATQGDLTMSVFYFYNAQGEPRWVWADNIGSGERQGLRATSFIGRCPGCAAMPAAASPAGSLSLAFDAEAHGSLSANLRIRQGETYDWSVTAADIGLLSNPGSGRDRPFRLMPFTSADTLEAYLEYGLTHPAPYAYASGGGGDVVFSPAPASPAVSATNVQVGGVDEADVVKTDGGHIYALDGRTVRVNRVDRDAMALPEVAVIDLAQLAGEPQGLYLLADRGAGQPDLLVVVAGQTNYLYFDAWFDPYGWVDSQTELLMFDVTDPAAPAPLAAVVIDGGALETRRVADRLYVITRDHAFHPDLRPGLEPAQIAAVTGAVGLEQLLPRIVINGVSQPLVDPASTLLPPQPPGFRYPDLVTIAAFDLADPTAMPATVTFSGLAETVHVSLENLFVASSRYATSLDPAFAPIGWPDTVYTDIHQFELAADGPRYAGSGVVEGFLAWGGISPVFALSEHDGHLRVVTTSGQWEQGDHRVTVLALAGDDRDVLAERGHAPSAQRPQRLGKPGELLYGLRFIDDRLYAVTFKSIDPLYVVDLATPSDPRILGELEVTGFSDYLHPLPNNLLLGFGKEAIPAESPGDGGFAWYQGLQLSLFDVADPMAPRLVQRIDLGRRGSHSPLLEDHHAFAWLPPTASREGRVAVPVVIHDAAQTGHVSSDPTVTYPWQLTGLAMFDVHGVAGGAAALVPRGIAASHTRTTDPGHDAWADTWASAGRGIIDEHNAYFYLRGELYVAPWGEGGRIVGPY